eukprot:CAMPEP_0113450956 /NCGR_PEP_ID=MMETSP0014_2-20120614/6095_1 /TAXON_ID=2857 /ORGANISM="Nitzschia sp." /LENGTH=777 /DNA_ID=CAMNT_0000342307 /DNA_START=954 /DNA_END=3288 /DNA_ORIENTATION=- /assembly_acc=CAM_ASM_000159
MMTNPASTDATQKSHAADLFIYFKSLSSARCSYRLFFLLVVVSSLCQLPSSSTESTNALPAKRPPPPSNEADERPLQRVNRGATASPGFSDDQGPTISTDVSGNRGTTTSTPKLSADHGATTTTAAAATTTTTPQPSADHGGTTTTSTTPKPSADQHTTTTSPKCSYHVTSTTAPNPSHKVATSSANPSNQPTSERVDRSVKPSSNPSENNVVHAVVDKTAKLQQQQQQDQNQKLRSSHSNHDDDSEATLSVDTETKISVDSDVGTIVSIRCSNNGGRRDEKVDAAQFEDKVSIKLKSLPCTESGAGLVSASGSSSFVPAARTATASFFTSPQGNMGDECTDTSYPKKVTPYDEVNNNNITRIVQKNKGRRRRRRRRCRLTTRSPSEDVTTNNYSFPKEAPPAVSAEKIATSSPSKSFALGDEGLLFVKIDFKAPAIHPDGSPAKSLMYTARFRDGRRAPVSVVVDTLLDPSDASLRRQMIQLIKEAPFKALAIETVGVTKESATSTPFYFSLVDYPQLIGQEKVRTKAFDQYISKGQQQNLQTTSFPNLRKDATLLIPIPNDKDGDALNYRHLSKFFRSVPGDEVEAFLLTSMKMFKDQLSDTHVTFMSTNGLAVNHLHVRFEASPKHYMVEAYIRSPVDTYLARLKEATAKKDSVLVEWTQDGWAGKEDVINVDNIIPRLEERSNRIRNARLSTQRLITTPDAYSGLTIAKSFSMQRSNSESYKELLFGTVQQKKNGYNVVFHDDGLQMFMGSSEIEEGLACYGSHKKMMKGQSN